LIHRPPTHATQSPHSVCIHYTVTVRPFSAVASWFSGRAQLEFSACLSAAAAEVISRDTTPMLASWAGVTRSVQGTRCCWLAVGLFAVGDKRVWNLLFSPASPLLTAPEQHARTGRSPTRSPEEKPASRRGERQGAVRAQDASFAHVVPRWTDGAQCLRCLDRYKTPYLHARHYGIACPNL
jgi:hypothetical protein